VTDLQICIFIFSVSKFIAGTNPSSSNRLQASGIGTLSVVMSGQYAANVITAGKPLIMTKKKSVLCYIISQFACSYLKNNSMKRYSDNTV
jgi:hypothetical protein